MVRLVGDVDVPGGICRYTRRGGELAVPVAERAPFREKDPVAVEFLDAVIPGVSDVDVAPAIDRREGRGVELAVPLPDVPHFARKIPSLSNFWIRLLLVSTT